MLDKSTLQALSHDEMDELRRYFSLAIPPILLMEILADIKKQPKTGRAPTAKDLARRIVPSLSLPVMPNYRDLLLAELRGHRIMMDHRPNILRGDFVRTSDGERGTILHESPEELAIIRWQGGDFDSTEELLAETYRAAIRSIDLGWLQKELKNLYSSHIKPHETLDETALFVDDLIASGDPNMIFAWFADDTFGKDLPEQVRKTKFTDTSDLVIRYPYLHFCMKVSLMFHFALTFGLVTTRSTNRIDLEYFYYLPFTLIFSSGDLLHVDLHKHVHLPKNEFCHRDDLKRDLARIRCHHLSKPESGMDVAPPDLDPESFTFQSWKRHMKPVSRTRENKLSDLSVESAQKMMQRYQSMMDGELESGGASSDDWNFLFRPIQVQKDGPCICHSGKTFRDCCGIAICRKDDDGDKLS